MALFLSCVFVCLFAAVEQDEKTWPTHPAISVDLYHLSQKNVLFVVARFFVCLFVFFLVKIIIVIIAVGIGG